MDGCSYSAAEGCLSVEGLAFADTGAQTAVVLVGGGCVAWDDGMKVFSEVRVVMVQGSTACVLARLSVYVGCDVCDRRA